MDAITRIHLFCYLLVLSLWKIRHVDRDVIEEEVAVDVVRNVSDADAEVGIREVAKSPRASPCIRRAS